MQDGGDTEAEVPVDKVEVVSPRPAVELGFDPLRVGVRGQLLAGVRGDQKQCEGVRVRDVKLVSAQSAHLLGGGVRVDDEGFGRAARVHFLQGYTEKVLQGGT